MYSYRDFKTVSLEGNRFYNLGNDIYYPSITTVLGNTISEEKKQSLENWRNSIGHEKADAYTKFACDRGTIVHELIEKHLKKEKIIERKYAQEHIKLFNSVKVPLNRISKVYGQEVVLFSNSLKVAGRCDLIAIHDNEISIIDYKTSGRGKDASEIEDYFLQTCFYALSHNEMFNTNIEKLVIIMAVENGIPRVFKKYIDEDLIIKLINRIDKFYSEL